MTGCEAIDQDHVWHSEKDSNGDSCKACVAFADTEEVRLCENVIETFEEAIDKQIQHSYICSEEDGRRLAEEKIDDPG